MSISQFFLAARNDVTDGSNDTQKRKENPGDVTNGAKRMKRSTEISHSQYEKLKRENAQLKKQLNTLQTNWMRKFSYEAEAGKPFSLLAKPLGAAAAYFVDMGRILSGKSQSSDDEMERGDLLETICTNLNMSESELKNCEHRTDITKTCRQLTKYVYRDAKKRASELVSTMNPKILQAIQGLNQIFCYEIIQFVFVDYARLAHPVQARTPNSVLNNAIGNVFAAEKRKSDQEDTEMVNSDELNEESECEETFDRQ